MSPACMGVSCRYTGVSKVEGTGSKKRIGVVAASAYLLKLCRRSNSLPRPATDDVINMTAAAANINHRDSGCPRLPRQEELAGLDMWRRGVAAV